MWLVVEKHENIGFHDVFDLSIPDTHNFIANGFVVHNCFLNSALQCLFHVPELETYFIRPAVLNGRKVDSAYTSQHRYFSKSRSNVLKEFGDQFQKLFLAVNDSRDSRPIRPMSFRRVLSVFKPVYRTAQQQDAHECLILILDKLHESLKMKVSINITGDAHNQLEERKKHAFNQYKSYIANTGYSEINKVFYGQFESTVVCNQCSTPSFNYDPYCSLEVEIPQTSGTLYDCLDDYCFKELLQGEEQYNCDKCKTKVNASKELKIWTLPKVLIIQLKRFNTRLRKNNRHISCPMKLNMTKYVTHPASQQENGDVGLQLYNLIGVIEHSGNLQGGHYTAKCKVDGGVGWKMFNDASVSTIQEKDVITTNSYVLVYKMDEHTQQLWNKH
jgi:ubiquitin carboxyl-terminal hydrolase 8